MRLQDHCRRPIDGGWKSARMQQVVVQGCWECVRDRQYYPFAVRPSFLDVGVSLPMFCLLWSVFPGRFCLRRVHAIDVSCDVRTLRGERILRDSAWCWYFFDVSRFLPMFLACIPRFVGSVPWVIDVCVEGSFTHEPDEDPQVRHLIVLWFLLCNLSSSSLSCRFDADLFHTEAVTTPRLVSRMDMTCVLGPPFSLRERVRGWLRLQGKSTQLTSRQNKHSEQTPATQSCTRVHY